MTEVESGVGVVPIIVMSGSPPTSGGLSTSSVSSGISSGLSSPNLSLSSSNISVANLLEESHSPFSSPSQTHATHGSPYMQQQRTVKERQRDDGIVCSKIGVDTREYKVSN